MKSIYLLGTTHEEKDLTTIEDLYKKLKEIDPDCIYEEVPVDMAEDIYINHKYPDSIEVKAIRKYLQDKPELQHIAIDLDHLPQISNLINDEDIENLVEDYMEKQSKKCKASLISDKIRILDSQGHKIINSKKHQNLVLKLNKITYKYLLKNNKDLYYKHRQMDFFHYEIRECFMMSQILKTIEQYERPLIMIGYYHLPSITKKLKKTFKGYKIINC